MDNQVYRVFSDSSGSRYDDKHGFLAGDQNFDPGYYFDSVEDMQIHVTNHFRWSKTTPTPFVSASTSAANTLIWANKNLQSGLRNVRIAIIDLLSFRRAGGVAHTAKDKVDDMGLVHPHDVERFVGRREYLFEGSIPARFVKRVFNVDEFTVQRVLQECKHLTAGTQLHTIPKADLTV